MEETISLKDIAVTLKKRLVLITLITVIAVTVSGIISYFVLTPIYQATTQILVNQKTSEQPILDVNQIKSNVEMINTYSIIIKSPVILDKVIEKLELSQTAEELTNSISVTSEQDAQVFNLSVENEDPQKAVLIANTIAQTFHDDTPVIMSTNNNNVKILSPAVLKDNEVPIKPKPLLNMAVALVVGLMTGIGIAFLLEYLDNTIKTEEDIQNILQLPLLGTIPKISIEDEKKQTAKLARKRMGSETLES